jgi:zinc protease
MIFKYPLLIAFFASIICGCENNIQLKIDSEKYLLENGLEVIIHVDRSDPIAALSLLYHVGSGRETEGRSGFAHLFEHMLFQQSQHVGKGQFFKKVYEVGGTMNGFTWSDGTGYYEVVPKNALELGMWMESDRMGWLLSTITDSALINEKEIVQNEKRQRYDNQPYGLTNYVIDKILYPQGHPYNWQTIGEMEDIGNATLKDVVTFYKKWYRPNNVTLVVAGDLDMNQTKEWIEKYFGEIERGPHITKPHVQRVTLKETKKYQVEDNYASSPELNMVFPSTELYHKDSYALNLLADLLAKGKKSPLYKIIVDEEKLAPSVSAYNLEEEIAGYFRISVRSFSHVNLDEVERAILNAFKMFETEGFNEADLNRIKAGIERAFYKKIESLVNKSFELAKYNTFAGSASFINQDINNYLAVSTEQIKAVYNTYIKDKNYVLTSFVPKGKQDLAASGSDIFKINEEKIDMAGLKDHQKSTTDIILPEKIPSRFDRSTEPEKGPVPEIKVPQVWTHVYDNGLKISGIENNELPLVHFQLILKGGMLLDNPQKIGVANLVCGSMMEGTRTKTPLQLQEAIENTGSAIRIIPGKEIITIDVQTIKSQLESIYQIFEEMLTEPRWDEKEFEKIVERTIEGINRRKSSPQQVAASVFNKLVYGPNILGNDIHGNSEVVKNLSIEDLKEYYSKHFSPSISFISIVGDIKKEEAVTLFSKLEEKWPAKEVIFRELAFPDRPSESQLYFVDIPKSKQSHIRIGYLAMPYHSDDYYPAYVINYNLGGSINGRFDKILREEKGYTYGARSAFYGTAYPGAFTAYAAVISKSTADAVRTFKDIMNKYRMGISEEELNFTKNALLLSNARNFETNTLLNSYLNRIGRYNLEPDYILEHYEILKKMTTELHKEYSVNLINPDKMIYLVVGDAETQIKELEKRLSGKAILLDVDGNEVH